jgi:GMP synthase-like glutamine amidotransferase
MRLHLFEHEPFDIRQNNIITWAENKGYEINRTDVFKGDQLPSQNDYDWLIVLGGFQHAWQEQQYPWLAQEKQFILEALLAKKVILGICFGAQLLAEALGGRVFQNGKDEIGWRSVRLSPEGKRSFLFKNLPETFLTFHWHSDHFSLPPGCSGLAYSEPTPYQAYTHKAHRIAGLQFHPEYTIEMVRSFARDYGHEWKKDKYVAGKEAVLSASDKIPETYWLMEQLLDNMEREFGQDSGN